jgi:hypothetical protein
VRSVAGDTRDVAQKNAMNAMNAMMVTLVRDAGQRWH